MKRSSSEIKYSELKAEDFIQLNLQILYYQVIIQYIATEAVCHMYMECRISYLKSEIISGIYNLRYMFSLNFTAAK